MPDLLKEELLARERLKSGGLTGGFSARIGPRPEPSRSRKILEMLTGYPSDPMREVDASDLLLQAIALGGGRALPILKARGAALIKKIQEHGLPEQKHPEGLLAPFFSRETERKIANTEKTIVDALTFAQQKYPRIFGHIEDITSDPLALGSNEYGRVSNRLPLPALKEGIVLKINPRTIALRQMLGDDPSLYSGPATVGHELLHVADTLAYPDFLRAARFSKTLPHGYWGSQFEYRARNAGESFLKKFEEWKARQLPPLFGPP